MALTNRDTSRNVSTFIQENYSNFDCSDKASKFSLFFGNGQSEFVSFLLQAETVLVLIGVLSFIVVKCIGKNNDEKKASNSEPKANKLVPRTKKLLPFRLPFIDGFLSLYSLQKNGVRILEEWKDKYGSLFELPLGVISVYPMSDVSMIQKVLASTSPLHMNKPRYIYDKIFLDCMHDGLVNSEYHIWSHHRKLLSRAFTYRAQHTYVKFMNRHAKNLVNSLLLNCSTKNDDDIKRDDNNSGESIEGEKVWNLLYFHAVKIIINLVMGSGRLSDDEIANFSQNFVRYKHIVLQRMLQPHLHFQPYWYFHPMKKEYDRLSHECDVFFNKAIQIYRNEYEQTKLQEAQQHKTTPGLADKRDQEAYTLEMGNKSSEDEEENFGQRKFTCLIEEMLQSKASDKEIYDEVGTFITAGHETTVNAVQFLLMHLALNPEQQTRCKEEIDNLIDSSGGSCNGKTKSPNDVDLTMDDLSSLKYLERCILESLRMTPTIPMFLRRLDAPLKIDENLVLHEGANVAVITWILQRDPEHYPDPERFDPDRFLPENIRTRHSFAFIPFSSGARNCIGWKVAIMEIKVIMSWIIRNFDIYTTDKLDDVKLLFEVTLQPQRNYNVILKKRKK